MFNKVTKSVIDAVTEILLNEEQQIDEKIHRKKRTTDTLKGPVPGGEDNQHVSYKVQYKFEESEPSDLEQLDEIGNTINGKDIIKQTVSRAHKVKDSNQKTMKKSLFDKEIWTDALHKAAKADRTIVRGNRRLATEELSFSEKLLENMKFKDENDTILENAEIDEDKMTAAQKNKREEIVLSMKDKEKQFKSKYGKNWKNVMYATATKLAMKEEKQDDDVQIDEAKRPDVNEVPFVTSENNVKKLKEIAKKCFEKHVNPTE